MKNYIYQIPYVDKKDSGAKIQPVKANLTKGKSTVLNLIYSGTGQTVKWTTSNEKVAAVKAGKVTAKAPGKAAIKAKIGSLEAGCTVTVKAK